MILVALQVDEDGAPCKEYVRVDDIFHTAYKRADKVRECLQSMGRKSNCGKVAVFQDGPTGGLFNYVPDSYEQCFKAGTIAIV